MKRILDVGNCGPDHAAIKQFFTQHFDCDLMRADRAEDALAQLESGPVDLVVVNRKLDIDYSDGLEVIRQIKANPSMASTPVMLITNYPEHQDKAIQIGALRGFGKLEFGKPEAIARVREALGE